VVQLRDRMKETPEGDCRECFSEEEWQTLWMRQHKRPWRPEDGVPTLQEVTRWLGRLGGHLGRKCDGQPGAEVLSRGLYALALLLEGRQIGRAEAAAPAPCDKPPVAAARRTPPLESPSEQ
jgi:hypothetical protein